MRSGSPGGSVDLAIAEGIRSVEAFEKNPERALDPEMHPPTWGRSFEWDTAR
jgi:hypothetical protein